MRPSWGRLSNLLLVSFGLTVLSFFASTVVAEYRARGIEDAAKSIATSAVPSIDHLSRTRTALGHLEMLSNDWANEILRGRRDDELEAAVDAAHRTVSREWTRYARLPVYESERQVWRRIHTEIRSVDATFNEIGAHLTAGHAKPALQMLRYEVEPAIDRIDDELLTAIEINSHRAARLSVQIESFRKSSRAWAIALDVLSAFFTAVTAIAVVRVVRRQGRMAEVRVSELEQFSGRVAHDIRSPLASVGLALDVAAHRPEIDARSRTMLERAMRTLQRVGQIVDGLLVFARAGAGPEDGPHADLAEIVHGVTEEFLPTAREKDIDLRVEPIPPRVVACSPGVLTSLLSNLVGNAIKYMGDATTVRRVTVRAHDVGPAVRVEVEDTGPGVPSDARERIFDPYVRAAESAIPGLGLGLATVRRLAEAHGGAVGLDADRETGSVFWFEVPRAPRPAPTAPSVA